MSPSQPILAVVFDIAVLKPLRENSLSYYGLIKHRAVASADEARWTVVRVKSGTHDPDKKVCKTLRGRERESIL